MTNILSRLASGLQTGLAGAGGFLTDVAQGIEDPAFAQKQRQRQQLLTQLAGQDPRLQGIAQIGTPEALDILSRLSPLAQQPTQRRLAKDVSGFQRFVDTGERAFPGAVGQPIKPITPFQRESLDLRKQEIKKAKEQRDTPKPFTTVQRDEFRESRDQLQSGLDAIEAVQKELAETPSKFGAAGVIRGTIESGRGILGDIGVFIPGLEGISAAIRATPPTGTVKGLKGFG